MMNRFAVLEKLEDNADIKRALENIRENIVKISAKARLGCYDLKQHYLTKNIQNY
jgi:hypothetical protein